MSGHSHYATIKRQKEAKDQARGKVFSHHAKSIAIAIKEGGSADYNMNSKLRFAIEQAKADNMPKSNIDRILARAESAGNLETVIYEGFGSEGVGILVYAATDNKNRTAQEIKNLFERGGGSLAGPGAVSHNFSAKGLIVVKKNTDTNKQILSLIDLGVEEVEEEGDAIEVYVKPTEVSTFKDRIIELGYDIISFSVVQNPVSLIEITSLDKAKKVLSLLDLLEEQDDVQSVYSNIDIPDNIANAIKD